MMFTDMSETFMLERVAHECMASAEQAIAIAKKLGRRPIHANATRSRMRRTQMRGVSNEGARRRFAAM